jgi:hypothetical protein
MQLGDVQVGEDVGLIALRSVAEGQTSKSVTMRKGQIVPLKT